MTVAPSLCLPLAPAPTSDAGRGLVRLPPGLFPRLGVAPGDTVVISAGRQTHARVLPDTVPDGLDRLLVDGLLARNLDARWGQTAEIRPVTLPTLTSITLAAAEPRGAREGALRSQIVNLVLTKGDMVSVGLPGLVQVADLSPYPAGHVGPETRILFGNPMGQSHYQGIAGLRRQIETLREMVELPLQRPDLFDRLGLKPPRGVLLVGPPGTGKTLLARQVAEHGNARFLEIAAPEILSKHYGESEAALRGLFDRAERAAPSVIFIDEIDAIAPRRDGLSGEKQVERRVVAQLLALMDGLSARGRVIVMAATNLPDTLDPALRRPGRFDREIRFDVPDAADRAQILNLHLSSAPLAPDADPDTIAALAHGFVGADLAALATEAGMAALARSAAEAGSIAAVRTEDLDIRQSDLRAALRRARPSALRDTLAAGPAIRWRDIGGLDQAKKALTEAVIWPQNHPETVEKLGLAPPRGILLSGPPGTGKTLLVRALAAESGMNFIALPPARSHSPFLGEAERALADLFARARAAAPCLVFLDEIDTIAPARGRADAASDRLLAQLLIEIDGLSDNRGLVMIGATNRPEAIDPALVRLGRIDLHIRIAPPDAAARAEILMVHLRQRPVPAELDLRALVQATAGFTGAELYGLVQEAARIALGRAVSENSEAIITLADLDAALPAVITHRIAPEPGPQEVPQ